MGEEEEVEETVSKQQVCIQRALESITYDGERVKKQKKHLDCDLYVYPGHAR